MKKILLTFSAAALSIAALNAQTRLSLYEEFSGENCGPCAAANPGLWTLLNGNTSKVLLIKYQSPIPSAGPIFNLYKTVTNARLTYYNVPFAPYGRLNGTGLGTGTAASGSPGHVANLTQTDINNDYNAGSPFTIAVTHSWNATGDSVTANVTITSTSAFAPAGANMKLRLAIIEHLTYATPPGTNGETDFHNVVREMVPDANGTQLPNSWTANQTQTYTIKGKVPGFINKASNETVMVAFIQNETDKAVPQAAKSVWVPVTRDAGLTAITTGTNLFCLSGTASGTTTSTVTLKNTGTTALTSAKIFYKASNSASYTSMNWTGNLAAGATTTVTTPAIAITVGATSITDSVGEINGVPDMNGGNSAITKPLTVIDPTPVTLPHTQSFEMGNVAGFPAKWTAYDQAGTGNIWINGTSGTDNLCRNGSNNMAWYKVGTYPSGSVGYLIMPTPGTNAQRALDFWHAYAQKSAANNDRLEVVYSTNCGTSWTPIWGDQGTSLSTTSPKTTANWLPSPAAVTTDWRKNSVSLNNVPAGAILAFRATANGGNNMFIDDVNIRNGNVGVENMIVENSLKVYPNPSRDAANLEFNLAQAGEVTVNVTDATGRTVLQVQDGKLAQGNQHLSINTAQLAAGLYHINIRTEAGNITQRLSVVK